MIAQKLSRRERRRLEIHDRILQSAAALFEADGYEATTVHQIAEHADVAYGTFFKHYPTKLDVLRELSSRTLRELFVDVEEIRKGPGSFTDHLIQLFEGTAERAVRMGQHKRALLGVMMSMAYPETAVTDNLRFRVALGGLMQDGFDTRSIRDDVDPETLVEVVVGTWYSMFRSWVHLDGYPLLERARSAAHFLANTLEGPRAR